MSELANNDPIEVDVNTDNLDDFSLLMSGKATAKAPVSDNEKAENNEQSSEDNGVEEENTVEDVEDDDTALEQEEAENKDEEESDSDDADDIFKPKNKNRKSAKERIDEITAERYAEKRRADAAEQRLLELEKRLNSFESRKQEQEVEPEVTRTAVDPKRPNPDALGKNGEPLYPLGEFDPQYIADLTDYQFDKRSAAAKEAADRENAQRAAIEEQTRLGRQWEEKLGKSESELPDLRETIAGLETTFRNVEPEYGAYLAKTVMEMDMGPEVLYYLAINPDEAQEIVKKGAVGATIALGRLEGQISSAMNARNKAKAKRPTAAPQPPSITRGNGATGQIRADTDDLEAFESIFFNRKKR